MAQRGHRLIADEFFRGSYTTGFWLKGEIATKFKYLAMIANNLSTLGVSAAQLDNTFDTTSFMLQWLPTTGEFGLYGTFGDFDYHEKLATRLAIHYTHSTEDKQSQPGSDSIENTQIRLTDGSSIFTPDLFGQGITVERVKYQMSSVDGGLKYKGLSLEAEWYWRWLSDYTGINTASIPDIDDHGYQVQASAMVVPSVLQAYVGNSGIYGVYGDDSEVRAGVNCVSGQTARLPREHRVDPRESLAGRIHGVSAARRRQRRRVPREPRTEFLRSTQPSRCDGRTQHEDSAPAHDRARSLPSRPSASALRQTPAGGAGCR